MRTRIFLLLNLAMLGTGLSGCLEPGTAFQTAKSSSTSASSTVPAGPMAAQVIFTNQAAALTGSFSTAPSGTPAVQGGGLPAVVLFNADGSKLANTTSDPNWPQWLSSVELGITGPNSKYSIGGTQYSSSASCARFADPTQSPGGVSQSVCNFGGVNVPCEAPANTFRVSEMDCDFGIDPNGQAVASGNGSQTDNVYIRANFNRAALGPNENVMVVINYAASAFHPADPKPSDCFSITGQFTPESCSDYAWKVYLRHNATEVVQPFMVFLPPTYSYVQNNPNATAATPATRQFIIPLAGDSGIQTVQFSRLNTQFLQSTSLGFAGACDPNNLRGAGGANSPLCAGIVIYSVTFFRI